VTVVRPSTVAATLVIVGLLAFTLGAGVLAYLAAWVIIPEEGEESSIVENMIKKNQNG